MFKGERLVKGDTIALVAPASPTSKDAVQRAVGGLEKYGFNVVVGKSCYMSYGGYLAGDRSLRAGDLHEMFANPHIKGIVCLRGGYGSMHLLPLLNFDLIRQNPKVFVGFSDITALHLALVQKAHLVTFHGPNMAKGLNHLSKTTKEYFLKSVTTKVPVGEVVHENDQWAIQSLTGGSSKGHLIGGNLSLISATLGTPFEIDTKNKILFIEDVNEPLYKIDRMLTQLALAGKFADAAGIVLGTWYRCERKNNKDTFTLIDIFKEIIEPFQKPTIYNVPAGHGPENVTLPLGVEVMVNADEGRLFIQESAVRDDF